MGRPSTNKNILKARGARRANDEKHTNNPEGNKARPTMPGTLTPGAKAIWKKTIPLLEEMGILCLSDSNILERYCIDRALWIECMKVINKDGLTFLTKYDEPKLRPEARMLGTLSNSIHKMEGLLGLSPSARADVKVDNPIKKNNDDTDEEPVLKIAK